MTTNYLPHLPPHDWPADDALFDDWLAAWAHVGEIRGWLGRDDIGPYLELTTGAELCTCPERAYGDHLGEFAGYEIDPQPGCRYHFPTGRCRCVWDVTHPTQRHRIPNRNCPAHWQPPEPPAPAVPPCTCQYQVIDVYLPLNQSVGVRVVARTAVVIGSCFQLDPWCPHHGEPPRWTPTDRPWETTLGPDERS